MEVKSYQFLFLTVAPLLIVALIVNNTQTSTFTILEKVRKWMSTI